MTRAWLHFLGVNDVQIQNAITQRLVDAGLNVHPLNTNAPSCPGALFFSQVTQQLYDSLREISRNGLERVLAVTVSDSQLSSTDSWSLLQAGASDVFRWNHSANTAGDVASRLERWDTVDQLVRSPLVQNNLVGQSPVFISVLRQIVDVARFTNASVLITGETGTGKELAARLIHTLDAQTDKRNLVVLDCTTIVPDLSGSEFFGHERGSFTGAVASRDGAFALANNGTLFLDEVGELPPRLQAQLLRVVQEHTYKRVGGNTWYRTDFRLVCATNKDLLQEAAQGRFRSDLYYRIAGWICKLPSLRERTEDILPLVRYFMKQSLPNEELPALSEPVCEYLLKREYPGNIRDLKQLVSRIMYRHVGPGPITVGDIPEEERLSTEIGQDWHIGPLEQAIRRALSLGVGLKEISRIAEETAVRIAVSDENGNLQRAARKLSVTDRALQMRRAARRQNEQPQDANPTD